MDVCQRLLERGDAVLGVDSLSAYYDVSLKERRLAALTSHSGFAFERLDLADRSSTEDLFRRAEPDGIVHLAAQPGVRHSLEAPHACVDANVNGFLNVLE